jgi:hypothetical protein
VDTPAEDQANFKQLQKNISKSSTSNLTFLQEYAFYLFSHLLTETLRHFSIF